MTLTLRTLLTLGSEQVSFPHHLTSPILSRNRWGRWSSTDDFTTSFLHFSLFSTCPLGLGELQDLSIPRCCLPTSSSACLVSVLARWF